MFSQIRPFLARIISPLVVSVFAWLALKLGLTVDPDIVTQTTETVVGIVIWVVGGMLAGYGWLHKTLNKWLNPADVADKQTSPTPPRKL